MTLVLRFSSGHLVREWRKNLRNSIVLRLPLSGSLMWVVTSNMQSSIRGGEISEILSLQDFLFSASLMELESPWIHDSVWDTTVE